MRWKQIVVGLALTVAGVAGCKQQCFLLEADLAQYQKMGLPSHLETDPKASVLPTRMAIPRPPTVNDPERKPRFLSLSEAIALALEHGTTGAQSVVNPGFANDNLISFSGQAISGDDAIRVLSLDPAIIGTDIEASLAKFDAQWTASMNWNVTDQPLNGLNQFQSGSNAAFNTALLKPLATGGVAGITFSTQYQELSNPPRGFTILNPAYTPRLQFQFEQPLLQGYGVEINQLRASHPGSVLTPFPTGGRVPGVLINRIRFDQQRAEFAKDVHFMLYNVEVAYWNLYGAYWTLYSREQALRQAYEAWKISKARFEAGRIPVHDFAQTRQQFELFRGQRLTALGQILENERQLRGLLGLPAEDGTRLVPIDAPTLTPFEPDWADSVNETLALRPELIQARNDLKFRQLDLINVKNLLLPDLRFTSTYALNGIGTKLDGTTNNEGTSINAFRSLAADRFTDWSIGLRFSYNLGYRDAHAQTRLARLNLARSYRVLQDQEDKAQRFLALQYRHLFEFHEQIAVQRAQREAAAIQLESRFREFQAGRGTLDILLEAQRVWADALRAEFDAVVSYNNALVGFEFARGTILDHDNVVISEGPLPEVAQVRAVEHARERSKALVLRQRADPSLYPACDPVNGCPGVPKLPADAAPPVPAMLESSPAAPEPTGPVLPKLLEGQAPIPDITEPMPTLKTGNSGGSATDLTMPGTVSAASELPPSVPVVPPAGASPKQP
jgi:outer membrane protein TolC